MTSPLQRVVGRRPAWGVGPQLALTISTEIFTVRPFVSGAACSFPIVISFWCVQADWQSSYHRVLHPAIQRRAGGGGGALPPIGFTAIALSRIQSRRPSFVAQSPVYELKQPDPCERGPYRHVVAQGVLRLYECEQVDPAGHFIQMSVLPETPPRPAHSGAPIDLEIQSKT